MKSIHFLLPLLMSVFIVSSCNKNKISDKRIYSNKSISIELLNVNESRCAEGAICVWEGNAGVEMRIKEGDNSVDFILNTHSTKLKDTILYNYRIEMIDVSPYPILDESVKLKDYKIKLEVTKQ